MEQNSCIFLPESQQTHQLNFILVKLKLFRVISIFFAIICLILAITLFLTWNVQIQIQRQIKQNSKVELCTNLFFNSSNLVDFVFKMSYASDKDNLIVDKNMNGRQIFGKDLNGGQTFNLTTLDISQNKIQKFCSNSMPFLKSLKLFDNPLKQMSDNNFPMIYQIQTYSYSTQTISLQNLQRFQNNYFPIIYYNFFDSLPVYYFNGNYMPQTRQPFIFKNRIKQFKNNTLGITAIHFQIVNQSLQIRNNTIPYLKQLMFSCQNQDVNSQIIVKDNYFPYLSTLYIECNPKKMKYENNSIESIKRIYYKSSSIQQWSNNQYNQLQQLVISSSNLKYIQNNSFQSLTFLSLFSTSLIDICTQNNYSSNLSQINFQTSPYDFKLKYSQDTKIDCFQNAPKLKYIRFYDVSLNFSNFHLPSLNELSLHFSSNMNQKQNYFCNNSFPSIDRTSLKNLKIKSFTDANIIFGSRLQQFQMLDSNVTSLIFDKQMPQLYSLNATNCQLKNLNCSTFRNIDFLGLSGNQLRDDVIDSLIDCNFGNPGSIYLDNNLIIQKGKARSKLSSRYPRTFISL